MVTILAKISYDGTNYYGWQKQPNLDSIEERVTTLLSSILNEDIKIFASGRTDAGVHALGQTFSFETTKDDVDLEKLRYALNRLLPKDIEILSFEKKANGFHARYSAKSKTYRYLVSKKKKDVMNANKMHFIHDNFDIQLARKAAKLFEGEHRFFNFTTKEEDENNYVRIIFKIDILEDDSCIIFELKGNGFMRYMVRMIVGTLLKVGFGKLSLEEVTELLNSDTSLPGTAKVPACGLYLVEVEY